MTTPTSAATTTPTPPTTTTPVTPPTPARHSVRERARRVSERAGRLFSKVRIYPVEITNRQHVANLIVGIAVLVVMGFFLISLALSNPDSSGRFSPQAFSGRAGLVIGIGVIALSLYSCFWLVKRKAWHSIWLLAIIAFVVLMVTPAWLRFVVGIYQLLSPVTALGICAGVISLVLTIYIVIRLGATTSFDQELQDAQAAVANKETVLRRKQTDVDNAQTDIVPMQTTKANAEVAEQIANTAYEAAVKDREDKEKIRNKFVKKDKTVPAAEVKVERAKLNYSATREQIDPLRKALNFAETRDELLPIMEAALDALKQFDAKYATPLTGTQPRERDLLVQRNDSLKKLDDLLAELVVRDKAVKRAEKDLTKAMKARDKKPEVANHTAALKAEQEAAKERDEKVAANKVATDALNAQAIRVGELEEARKTLTTERDELQSTADSIELELGSKSRKFLIRLGIATLVAMVLIAGFAR